MTGDMVQVVENLRNKHKVLSSNPSTAKKKKKDIRQYCYKDIWDLDKP
jgi:hypothetical protein